MIIPALRRLGQNCEFKTNLGYIARDYLVKKRNCRLIKAHKPLVKSDITAWFFMETRAE